MPKGAGAERLAAWNEGLRVMGMPLTLQMVQGIARVVVHGLEPLAEMIRAGK